MTASYLVRQPAKSVTPVSSGKIRLGSPWQVVRATENAPNGFFCAGKESDCSCRRRRFGGYLQKNARLAQDFDSRFSLAVRSESRPLADVLMKPTHELTRASLILRLQDAEDVAAWDEFATIYGPVVFNVATSHGFQAADADNLVQEVFMAVAGSVSNWLERDDRGSFRAWLLRIARNAAVDMITQKATRSLGRDGIEAQVHLANLRAQTQLSSALDLEFERMVFQWASERVRESVAERTWQAFWLTSIEDLSVEAAATKLNTRPGNIYFARSRVMARIKELVQQYQDQQ